MIKCCVTSGFPFLLCRTQPYSLRPSMATLLSWHYYCRMLNPRSRWTTQMITFLMLHLKKRRVLLSWRSLSTTGNLALSVYGRSYNRGQKSLKRTENARIVHHFPAWKQGRDRTNAFRSLSSHSVLTWGSGDLQASGQNDTDRGGGGGGGGGRGGNYQCMIFHGKSYDSIEKRLSSFDHDCSNACNHNHSRAV